MIWARVTRVESRECTMILGDEIPASGGSSAFLARNKRRNTRGSVRERKQGAPEIPRMVTSNGLGLQSSLARIRTNENLEENIERLRLHWASCEESIEQDISLCSSWGITTRARGVKLKQNNLVFKHGTRRWSSRSHITGCFPHHDLGCVHCCRKPHLISHNLRITRITTLNPILRTMNDGSPAGLDSNSGDTHPARSVPGMQSDHPELQLAFEQE